MTNLGLPRIQRGSARVRVLAEKYLQAPRGEAVENRFSQIKSLRFPSIVQPSIQKNTGSGQRHAFHQLRHVTLRWKVCRMLFVHHARAVPSTLRNVQLIR